jgi:putative restriction endonuclease
MRAREATDVFTTLLLAIATRLEKAATDNGFDLAAPAEGGWLGFGSSQTRLRIWLSALGESLFVLALSRRAVFEGLDGHGIPFANPLPEGASSARSVSDLVALHRMVRRAFQLSRALPDEPLQVFLQATATLPTTTEAERLVVQRVGQNVFRSGLIDYWEGRCPVSGLAVVELLRASHIKPWADCETDAERLDVFNGLLLAPHLDAAFDRGFMTLDDEGHIVFAHSLDASARAALGLDGPLQAAKLTDSHRAYLSWHRERVFRGPGGVA